MSGTEELPLVYRSAPFSNASTSQAAALEIREHLPRLERMVLERIAWWGPLCDHELEAALRMAHQTVSARRRGLVLRGLVEDSGIRRKTASGRNAIAWQVKAQDNNKGAE